MIKSERKLAVHPKETEDQIQARQRLLLTLTEQTSFCNEEALHQIIARDQHIEELNRELIAIKARRKQALDAHRPTSETTDPVSSLMNENESLKNQCTQLEQQIAAKQSDWNATHEELLLVQESLKSELEGLRATVQQTESRAAALAKEAEQVHATNAQLTAMNTDLVNRLAAENQALAKLQQQCEGLSQFESFVASFQTLVQTLDNHLFQMDEVISGLSTDQDCLAAIAALEGMKMSFDLPQLQRQADAQRRSDSTEVSVLKAECQRLRVNCTEEYKQLLRQYQQLPAPVVQPEQFKVELDKAQNDLAVQAALMEAQTERIAWYQQKYAEAEKEATVVIEAMEHAKTAQHSAQKELIKTQQELKETKATLRKYAGTIRALQEQQYHKDTAILKVRKELVAIKARGQSSNFPTPNSPSNERKLQKVIEDQENQIKVLKDMVKGSQGQVKQMNIELKRVSRSKRRLSPEVEPKYSFEAAVNSRIGSTQNRLPQITRSSATKSFISA